MKFVIEVPFKENIYNLMRKAGYHFFEKDEKTLEYNFVRPVGSNTYPRFHIFLTIKDKDLIFDLHLDQKKPIYKGVTAHSGEYEGEIVEKEAERIKEILSSPPSLSLGN